MKDTISISLIEHEGEVVGGSFKFAHPTPANRNAKTASSKATAKSSSRKAAPARSQPPAIPAALKWERGDEDYAVYADPQPYTDLPTSMSAAPQPPHDFYPAPTAATQEEDYQFAHGGIAYEGDAAKLIVAQRSRPRFLTFGFALVAVAIAFSGAAQFGKGGGPMLAGRSGFAINAAAQVAPYLQSQQPQADIAAPPQAQAAGNPAQRNPIGDYRLLGAPSISVATIEKVLQQYSSPASGNGQAFYDLGVKYGVDPAFMLAFYVHESGAGTQGAAVDTKSVGNIICPGWAGRCIGRFRAYDSYVQAAEDWYQLIIGNLYIGDGLDTPAKITPRYAPSSDNNDPNSYAKTVERLVDQWRSWQ